MAIQEKSEVKNLPKIKWLDWLLITELSKNGIPLVDNFWLNLLNQSIKGSVVQQI